MHFSDISAGWVGLVVFLLNPHLRREKRGSGAHRLARSARCQRTGLRSVAARTYWQFGRDWTKIPPLGSHHREPVILRRSTGKDGFVCTVVWGGEEGGYGRGWGASHFPSTLSGAAGLERPPGRTVASPARRPAWPKSRASHLPGLPNIPEKYTCSLWHVACNFTPAVLSPRR